MVIIYKVVLISWALIFSTWFFVVVFGEELLNNKICIATGKVWLSLTMCLSLYCVIELIVNI